MDRGRLQRRFYAGSDADRRSVLKVESAFLWAIEAPSPKMRAGSCIDQLGGDAHALTRIAHRAFEHVVNAELPPDLLHVGRLGFGCKTRLTGDDKEPADPRQRGGNLLHHPVREILLLRVATDVL